MRPLLVSFMATGLLLAGCGASGSTPPPVESASQSGEVAANEASDCSLGPPAQGQLREFTERDNDGVVGSIYNETGSTLAIGQFRKGKAPCLLGPGQRIAFALRSYTPIYVIPAGDRGGTLVTLDDPIIDYPRVFLNGYGDSMYCDPTLTSPDLGEGESWDSDTRMSGKLQIQRLDDDEDVARQWSGSSGHVDDWARMDVRIYRAGEGC